MSAGLIISALPLLPLCFFPQIQRNFSFNAFLYFILLLLFLIIHFLIVGYTFSLTHDYVRFLSSLGGGVFLIFSSFILASFLSIIDYKIQTNFFIIIMVLFLINGLASLTSLGGMFSLTGKPAFFFSEPSHFALALAPFFMFYIQSRVLGWVFVLLFFLIWTIYEQNLTMLLVIILSCGITFNFKLVLSFFAIFFTLIILCFDSSHLNYFIERLVLSSDSTNLSVLSFLQGWQNAIITLNDTNYLGVGFQQLGIASSFGDITLKIHEIYGRDLNLYDGSCLATKFISEFGLFGLTLVIYLTVRAIKSYFYIRTENSIAFVKFTHCVNISFMVELFMRGCGYFASGFFIYSTCYLFIQIKRTHINSQRNGIYHIKQLTAQ
jgi:hypothetical protein